MDGNRFALSHLVGKLLLVDDDVEKDVLFPDGMIKKLSERKELTLEGKGIAHFDIIAHVLPVMLCNSLPVLKDTGLAVANRAQLRHQPAFRAARRSARCTTAGVGYSHRPPARWRGRTPRLPRSRTPPGVMPRMAAAWLVSSTSYGAYCGASC